MEEIIYIYKHIILAVYSMKTISIYFSGKCAQESSLWIQKRWLKSEEDNENAYAILSAVAELLPISTFFTFPIKLCLPVEMKCIGNKPVFFSSIPQTPEK